MRLLISGSFVLLALSAFSANETFTNTNPFETARHEFEQGHLDRALASLEDGEKRGAPNAKALVLKGRILAEQQKFSEAVAAFDAAHQLEKTSLAGLYHGEMLLRQKKWTEALAVYEATMRETDILVSNERLRYALLIDALGAQNEAAAQTAFTNLPFPTETPAYYYAQAAWSMAHGSKSDGEKWIKRAEDIFPVKATAWFARPLYDFGWIKTKPPLIAD
ncbi:MAG: tetratricopeptide repeat protein [Chthoniobacterales bacterium]